MSLSQEDQELFDRLWKHQAPTIAFHYLRETDAATFQSIADPIALEFQGRAIGSDGVIYRIKKATAEHFDALIAPFHPQLHEVICVNFRYCERRKKGEFESEGLNLALAIADCLVMNATKIILPAVWTGVYLVKRGLLDRICFCE